MINNKTQENINTNITLMQGYDKIKPLEKLDGKSKDSIRVIIIFYKAVEIVNKKEVLKNFRYWCIHWYNCINRWY